MDFNQSNRIVLCRKGSNCCPVVERVTEDEITISDDFGGKVKLTADQFKMLTEVKTKKDSD